MAEFELEVDDDLADQIRRVASRLGVTPDEFASRAIRIYIADRISQSADQGTSSNGDS